MFIKELNIQNYRLFNSDGITISNLNVPNGIVGSGLNLLVGENGCGKTSILEALSLPLLAYKADLFCLKDLNDYQKKCKISLFSNEDFYYKSTMPKKTYKGGGFMFEGGLRNRSTKTYLSSIVVTDQKFIRAKGETEPIDSSQDLRVAVNNPFSGLRFAENDVLFMDKNRSNQTRKGMFSDTRFDRIMEDLNFQYLKKYNSQDVPSYDEEISGKIKNGLSNEFLGLAIRDFQEICNKEIILHTFDDYEPYKNAFFAEKVKSGQLIPINRLGSGHEMVFSLIYSFYQAQQSQKDIIIIIDEPEVHLHPTLQAKFVDFLLESSKYSQIFITSHSPLLVRQIMQNENAKVLICKSENSTTVVSSIEQKILPYISANEVNFKAFNLPTIDYHNELYGQLNHISGKYNEKDIEQWFVQKGIPQNKQWIRQVQNGTTIKYNVTLCTYIRNFIHHPENRQNDNFSQEELIQSITNMEQLLKET